MSVGCVGVYLTAGSLWYPWRLNEGKMTHIHLIAGKIYFTTAHTGHRWVTRWIGRRWIIMISGTLPARFHIFHDVLGRVADFRSFNERITSLIFRLIRLKIKVCMHCLILLRKMIRSWLRYLVWVTTCEDRSVKRNSRVRKYFASSISIFKNQRSGSLPLYMLCNPIWLLIQ